EEPDAGDPVYGGVVNLHDERGTTIVQSSDLYRLPQRELRVERVGSHELGQIEHAPERPGRGGTNLVYMVGQVEPAVVHPLWVAQPVGLGNGPSPEPWLDPREPLDPSQAHLPVRLLVEEHDCHDGRPEHRVATDRPEHGIGVAHLPDQCRPRAHGAFTSPQSARSSPTRSGSLQDGNPSTRRVQGGRPPVARRHRFRSRWSYGPSGGAKAWPAATQCLPVLTVSLHCPGQHEEIFAAIRVMQLSSANRAENTECELLDEGHLEEPVLRRASTSPQCGTLDGPTSAEARPWVFRIRAQVRVTCWRAGPDCDLAQLPIRPIPPMEYALSACWVRSNPLDSSSGLTRRPMVRSTALASNQVTVNEKTTVTTAARHSRDRRWKPPPLKRPFAPARLTVRVANNPKRTMPINPPTPWTPRTSRESS